MGYTPRSFFPAGHAMYSTLRSLMFRLPAETSHDLALDMLGAAGRLRLARHLARPVASHPVQVLGMTFDNRSEEHTSELQSRPHLVCRLLLEKKKNNI